MPNPKVGRSRSTSRGPSGRVKAGKVEFKVDKAGNVHVPVGKRSFAAEHLGANASAIIEALVKAKPAAAKGQYLRSVTVSTTMGPPCPSTSSASPASTSCSSPSVPTAAKTETIEDLRRQLGGATAAVLTEYRGLTVHQLSELRKQLKAASAISRRQEPTARRHEGSPLAPLRTHLTGPTGVVIGRKDPAAVAKAQGFAKANPALQGGWGWSTGGLGSVGPQGGGGPAVAEALRGQLVDGRGAAAVVGPPPGAAAGARIHPGRAGKQAPAGRAGVTDGIGRAWTGPAGPRR